MFPIRCFTCGKVIGNLENEVNSIRNKPDTPGLFVEFFKSKKINRFCCRRMIISHVDMYKYVKIKSTRK